MRPSNVERCAASLCCLALLSCGQGPPPGKPTSESWMPLRVGASWKYKVVDTGVTLDKTTTVEAWEEVGGPKASTKAFRVKSDDTTGYSLSWQDDVDDRVFRWRDQSFGKSGALSAESFYAPGKLRVDATAEHLAASASWTETFSEALNDLKAKLNTTIPRSESWSVEAFDEATTVPAGTFSCVRLKKVAAGATGPVEKSYWYAKGVGKVKEVGASRTEELVSYTLPK